MKTAAVVITYNPDADVAVRLRAIAAECNPVWVIDNGSSREALRHLQIASRIKGVKMVKLGENTGIAHAQNVGLKLAFGKNADGVILFDHDSTPQKNFAAALWNAYRAETQTQGTDVIVGSRIFDTNLRAFSKHPVYGSLFFRRKFCPKHGVLRDALMAIASGTLISSNVFSQVGGMREDFFIDYVDWEFCLRARRRFGVHTVICSAAVLQHARGIRTAKKFLGMTLHPPGYSLFRYQHIYRNRARLLRENFFHNRAFIAFELVALCRDSLLLFAEKAPFKLFFESLRSWFQGFLAIRGKTEFRATRKSEYVRFSRND